MTGISKKMVHVTISPKPFKNAVKYVKVKCKPHLTSVRLLGEAVHYAI